MAWPSSGPGSAEIEGILAPLSVGNRVEKLLIDGAIGRREELGVRIICSCARCGRGGRARPRGSALGSLGEGEIIASMPAPCLSPSHSWTRGQWTPFMMTMSLRTP